MKITLADLPDSYKTGHTSCIPNETPWHPVINLSEINDLIKQDLARYLILNGNEHDLRTRHPAAEPFAVNVEILGFNTLGDFIWRRQNLELNVKTEKAAIEILKQNNLYEHYNNRWDKNNNFNW